MVRWCFALLSFDFEWVFAFQNFLLFALKLCLHVRCLESLNSNNGPCSLDFSTKIQRKQQKCIHDKVKTKAMLIWIFFCCCFVCINNTQLYWKMWKHTRESTTTTIDFTPVLGVCSVFLFLFYYDNITKMWILRITQVGIGLFIVVMGNINGPILNVCMNWIFL